MQFKSLTKVNFAQETQNPLNEVSSKLLFMRIQTHAFHWQTFGLGIHKALGELYEAIGDAADDISESGMGIYGRPSFNGQTFSFADYSDETLVTYLNSCIAYLKGLTTVFSGQTDLLNMRDSLLGEFNKVKYLITLK